MLEGKTAGSSSRDADEGQGEEEGVQGCEGLRQGEDALRMGRDWPSCWGRAASGLLVGSGHSRRPSCWLPA